MSDRATARHRAPHRPLNPLDTLTDTLTGGLTAVSGSLGSAGRSGAVLAVSTGLVATMALPANAVTTSAPQGGADVARPTVVTAAVRARAVAEPTFERDALAVPKVAPKAASKVGSKRRPKVVQELRTTQKASRSAARTAPKATTGDSRDGVLAIARQYVGTPYVYGGTTPDGFDCSGFTRYVLAKVGVSLPRTSSQQYGAVHRISRGEARAGDLVFIFTGGRVTHVGFYLGGNRMIDSPRPGKSVQERQIWSSNVAFGRP